MRLVQINKKLSFSFRAIPFVWRARSVLVLAPYRTSYTVLDFQCAFISNREGQAAAEREKLIFCTLSFTTPCLFCLKSAAFYSKVILSLI
jgi:hypothetical protein